MAESTAVHYFASSALYWTVDTDLEKCKALQRQRDEACIDGGVRPMGFAVYRVPLPVEAPYEIVYYRPKVEGVELVEEVEYDWKEIEQRRRVGRRLQRRMAARL